MRVAAYLNKIADDGGAVLVPISMAQEYLGLSRTAILDLIKQGHLEEVRVKAGEKDFRGVAAGSLRKYLAAIATPEDIISVLEDHLIRHVKSAASEEPDGVATNYAPVMKIANMSWRSPQDRKKIGGLLDDISRRSAADKKRGFLLSAVVTLKATGLPSDAFFEVAKSLDMLDDEADAPTKRAFWNEQIKLIVKFYHGNR